MCYKLVSPFGKSHGKIHQIYEGLTYFAPFGYHSGFYLRQVALHTWKYFLQCYF